MMKELVVVGRYLTAPISTHGRCYCVMLVSDILVQHCPSQNSHTDCVDVNCHCQRETVHDKVKLFSVVYQCRYLHQPTNTMQ